MEDKIINIQCQCKACGKFINYDDISISVEYNKGFYVFICKNCVEDSKHKLITRVLRKTDRELDKLGLEDILNN